MSPFLTSSWPQHEIPNTPRLGEGVEAGLEQYRLEPIVKDVPRRPWHLPPRHHQITLSIPLPSQRHVDQSFEPLWLQGVRTSRLRQRAVKSLLDLVQDQQTNVARQPAAVEASDNLLALDR
jgi:hypothetical protein